MYFTVLTLLLAAYAVHAAPTGGQTKSYEYLTELDQNGTCLLYKHVKYLQKYLIHEQRFGGRIPESADRAHNALDRFKNLAKKSAAEVCKKREVTKFLKAMQAALGSYGFLVGFKEAQRKEAYEVYLVPNWDFLTTMVAKAAQDIQEGHYCESLKCAIRETFWTFSTFANNGKIDKDSIKAEVERIQDLNSASCTDEDIQKEKHCGGVVEKRNARP